MRKRARAGQFNPKVRRRIIERDGGCVFCGMAYHLPPEPQYIFDIMHIVNRSQGGLGIEENGVVGCRYHHIMLDNGNQGRREEMLSLIEGYMTKRYPGWDKRKLIYKKAPLN